MHPRQFHVCWNYYLAPIRVNFFFFPPLQISSHCEYNKFSFVMKLWQEKESGITFWTHSLTETRASFWWSSSTKSPNRRSRRETRNSESHFPCHLPSPVEIVIRRLGFGVILLLLLICCCSSKMNTSHTKIHKGVN